MKPDIHCAPRTRTTAINVWSILCFVCWAMLLVLQPLRGLANDDHIVSARYQRISGSMATVTITVGSPAPQSLILEQYLSPETQILSMTPAGRRIRHSGVVKWLFKNISPGSFDVTMQLEPPSEARKVAGTIRYRDPRSGQMLAVRIDR